MSFLLDTNTCISYLNNYLSPIRRKLEQLSPNQIFVCSVVKAELFYGAIALAHNVTVVTHNTDEFSRVPNLRIEDWEI